MWSTILSKSTDDICIHKHHKPISFMMVVNQWIYPSRCTTIIVIFHDQTSFINAMLLVELLLCIESFSLMAIIERPDHLNTQMCVWSLFRCVIIYKSQLFKLTVSLLHYGSIFSPPWPRYFSSSLVPVKWCCDISVVQCSVQFCDSNSKDCGCYDTCPRLPFRTHS